MADAHDPDSPVPSETTWAAYYKHTMGREPRPLFVRGLRILAEAGVAPGQAVEVGFGDGEETLALLAAGWRVLSIDSSPEAADVLRPRVPAELVGRLETRSVAAEDTELPPFDLLYAGYSLPFLGRAPLERFWRHALERMNPGAYLVVNLFGRHDSWVGRPEMQFLERPEVERLIDGLDVIALDETEADGMSFLGPKHWHTFDILARRPPG
jgi:cyclopropane fatty-acyl-phospholipid synthase-like methyltransferase